MIILVMGVTGCGKSTIGKGIADRFGLPFFDADDFHPPANREKLRAGVPLGDEDRWPWLRIMAEKMPEWESAKCAAVLACSALKKSYREVLASGTEDLLIVYIVADQHKTAERLRLRAGSHDLIRDFDAILAGQFRDLEPPHDAIAVSNDLPVSEMLSRVNGAIYERMPERLRVNTP